MLKNEKPTYNFEELEKVLKNWAPKHNIKVKYHTLKHKNEKKDEKPV